jgi:orotate phosphoribosyltransferase
MMVTESFGTGPSYVADPKGKSQKTNAYHEVVTSDEVLATFRRAGALLEGHFRLSSGLHSPGYLQSALVLQHPREAEAFGAAIAARARGLDVQAVLSPALGGIVIGQEAGRALGVRAIFAERQDGKLSLRRGFTLVPGERVLVVEDVITTGGSTRETIEVARAAGANVVGAAAIVDRSDRSPHGGSASSADAVLDVPFRALATLSLPTYTPDECPLCAAGLPVVKPGSRTV